ncbi:MAG: hypothetical protein WHS77_01925, partial [Brevinematales bacterium]
MKKMKLFVLYFIFLLSSGFIFVWGSMLKDYGIDVNEIEREVRFGKSISNMSELLELERRYIDKFRDEWRKRNEIGVEVGINYEEMLINVSNEVVEVIKSGILKRMGDEAGSKMGLEGWVERVKGLIWTNNINRWDVGFSISNMMEVMGAGFKDITNEFIDLGNNILSNGGVVPNFLILYLGYEVYEKEFGKRFKERYNNYLNLLINVKKVEVGKYIRKALYDDDSLRWYSEKGSAEYLMREEVKRLEEALSEFPQVEGMSEEDFKKWRDSVREKYVEGIKKWDELFMKMTEGMNKWMKEAREGFEEGEKYWRDGYRNLVRKRNEWTRSMEKKIEEGIKEWEVKSKENGLNLEKALKDLEVEVKNAKENYVSYIMQLQEITMKASGSLGGIEENIKFIGERINERLSSINSLSNSYIARLNELNNVISQISNYVRSSNYSYYYNDLVNRKAVLENEVREKANELMRLNIELSNLIYISNRSENYWGNFHSVLSNMENRVRLELFSSNVGWGMFVEVSGDGLADMYFMSAKELILKQREKDYKYWSDQLSIVENLVYYVTNESGRESMEETIARMDNAYNYLMLAQSNLSVAQERMSNSFNEMNNAYIGVTNSWGLIEKVKMEMEGARTNYEFALKQWILASDPRNMDIIADIVKGVVKGYIDAKNNYENSLKVLGVNIFEMEYIESVNEDIRFYSNLVYDCNRARSGYSNLNILMSYRDLVDIKGLVSNISLEDEGLKSFVEGVVNITNEEDYIVWRSKLSYYVTSYSNLIGIYENAIDRMLSNNIKDELGNVTNISLKEVRKDRRGRFLREVAEIISNVVMDISTSNVMRYGYNVETNEVTNGFIVVTNYYVRGLEGVVSNVANVFSGYEYNEMKLMIVEKVLKGVLSVSNLRGYTNAVYEGIFKDYIERMNVLDDVSKDIELYRSFMDWYDGVEERSEYGFIGDIYNYVSINNILGDYERLKDILSGRGKGINIIIKFLNEIEGVEVREMYKTHNEEVKIEGIFNELGKRKEVEDIFKGGDISKLLALTNNEVIKNNYKSIYDSIVELVILDKIKMGYSVEDYSNKVEVLNSNFVIKSKEGEKYYNLLGNIQSNNVAGVYCDIVTNSYSFISEGEKKVLLQGVMDSLKDSVWSSIDVGSDIGYVKAKLKEKGGVLSNYVSDEEYEKWAKYILKEKGYRYIGDIVDVEIKLAIDPNSMSSFSFSNVMGDENVKKFIERGILSEVEVINYIGLKVGGYYDGGLLWVKELEEYRLKDELRRIVLENYSSVTNYDGNSIKGLISNVVNSFKIYLTENEIKYYIDRLYSWFNIGSITNEIDIDSIYYNLYKDMKKGLSSSNTVTEYGDMYKEYVKLVGSFTNINNVSDNVKKLYKIFGGEFVTMEEFCVAVENLDILYESGVNFERLMVKLGDNLNKLLKENGEEIGKIGKELDYNMKAYNYIKEYERRKGNSIRDYIGFITDLKGCNIENVSSIWDEDWTNEVIKVIYSSDKNNNVRYEIEGRIKLLMETLNGVKDRYRELITNSDIYVMDEKTIISNELRLNLKIGEIEGERNKLSGYEYSIVESKNNLGVYKYFYDNIKGDKEKALSNYNAAWVVYQNVQESNNVLLRDYYINLSNYSVKVDKYYLEMSNVNKKKEEVDRADFEYRKILAIYNWASTPYVLDESTNSMEGAERKVVTNKVDPKDEYGRVYTSFTNAFARYNEAVSNRQEELKLIESLSNERAKYMEEYRERVMMESAYEWVTREGEMAKQEYDRTLNALTNELKGYFASYYNDSVIEIANWITKNNYSVIDRMYEKLKVLKDGENNFVNVFNSIVNDGTFHNVMKLSLLNYYGIYSESEKDNMLKKASDKYKDEDFKKYGFVPIEVGEWDGSKYYFIKVYQTNINLNITKVTNISNKVTNISTITNISIYTSMYNGFNNIQIQKGFTNVGNLAWYYSADYDVMTVNNNELSFIKYAGELIGKQEKVYNIEEEMVKKILKDKNSIERMLLSVIIFGLVGFLTDQIILNGVFIDSLRILEGASNEKKVAEKNYQGDNGKGKESKIKNKYLNWESTLESYYTYYWKKIDTSYIDTDEGKIKLEGIKWAFNDIKGNSKSKIYDFLKDINIDEEVYERIYGYSKISKDLVSYEEYIDNDGKKKSMWMINMDKFFSIFREAYKDRCKNLREGLVVKLSN